MCRLWRFLNGVFPFRFLSAMETKEAKIPTKSDDSETVSSADENAVKNPDTLKPDTLASEDVKVVENEDSLTKVINDPPATEPTNNPPPNLVEPVNKAPSPDMIVENEDSLSKVINDPPATEPTNNPPPNLVEPVNKAPSPDMRPRKNAEWSTKTSKEKNKPKKLDFKQMPLDEKRSYYRCGRYYVTLDHILPWSKYVRQNHYLFTKKGWLERDAEFTDEHDRENRRVSLWQGDITCLEVDAIVNAANKSLRGGGGVDGCIHRAAGRGLLEECINLNGCDTGDAKITSGQKLPAKNVIHTVGPIGERQQKLENCYTSCLTLMKEHKLNTMAFCSISTGVYGYPSIKAARVALGTVKTWLEKNQDWMKNEGILVYGQKEVQVLKVRDGRIIFCVFLQDDLEIYQELMIKYFPCTLEKKKTEASEDDTTGSKIKPKDENTSSTEVKDIKRGRGRGRGKGQDTSKEKPKAPTLLSLVPHIADDETNPKGDKRPHVEGNNGHAGSSFRGVDDRSVVDEKMDTSERGSGDTETVGSETKETTPDRKETEETTDNEHVTATHTQPRRGEDLSRHSDVDSAVGGSVPAGDISQMSSTDAGGASSDNMEIEESLDTSLKPSEGGVNEKTEEEMLEDEGDWIKNEKEKMSRKVEKEEIKKGDESEGKVSTNVGKEEVKKEDGENKEEMSMNVEEDEVKKEGDGSKETVSTHVEDDEVKKEGDENKEKVSMNFEEDEVKKEGDINKEKVSMNVENDEVKKEDDEGKEEMPMNVEEEDGEKGGDEVDLVNKETTKLVKDKMESDDVGSKL